MVKYTAVSHRDGQRVEFSYDTALEALEDLCSGHEFGSAYPVELLHGDDVIIGHDELRSAFIPYADMLDGEDQSAWQLWVDRMNEIDRLNKL